jgi:transcription initiation factor TFIID TATA-box-binding protein
MDSLTLPTTAAQAKAFVAPTSLSFPMSHAEQTPDPSFSAPRSSGTPMSHTASETAAGFEMKNAVTAGGVSGIVPTLQ